MPPATAGPSIAGDHRLSELETRRAHRTKLAIGLDWLEIAFRQRLEIGAGGEGAAGAGQHRDSCGRVGVEAFEGVEKRPRSLVIDSVAALGPLDRHDGHALVGADGNFRGHVGRRSPVWLTAYLARNVEGE